MPSPNEIKACRSGLESQHFLKWPDKPTKENPNPEQFYSVRECTAPYTMVLGPFDTEKEAIDAFIDMRVGLSIKALDEYRANADAAYHTRMDEIK